MMKRFKSNTIIAGRWETDYGDVWKFGELGVAPLYISIPDYYSGDYDIDTLNNILELEMCETKKDSINGIDDTYRYSYEFIENNTKLVLTCNPQNQYEYCWNETITLTKI